MDNNVLEMNMKRLRKELRATRIFCMISSVLTGVLLAGGIFLFGQLKPVFQWMQETQPVLTELAELDIDSVNLTLEQISYTLGSVDWQQVSDAVGSVDWQQVSDALAQLDVDAINEAIEGLDTEELSEAIENMNKAADVIEGLGEKINSFSNLFNR